MFVLDPPTPMTPRRFAVLLAASLIGVAVAMFFLEFVGGVAWLVIP